MRCGKERQHLVETLLDVDRLQHVLLFRRRSVDDAGDEVGERGGGIEVVDRRRHLGGHVRQQLHRLAGALAQQVDAGLDLRRQDLGDADLLDPRDQERKAGEEFDDAEAAHALADHMMGAVGRGDVAQDARDRSDRVQLLGLRVLDGRIGLQQDAERALGADRFLGGGDRRRPPDRQRQHHSGEQHGLAHRQDDEAHPAEAAERPRARSALCRCRVGHVAFLEIRAASSG